MNPIHMPPWTGRPAAARNPSRRHRPHPSSATPSTDDGSPAALKEHVIRILGIGQGHRTPFDGQWVKEYDPSRPGTDPNGVPMTAHLVTTPDLDQAMTFPSFNDAAEAWRKPSGHRRPDGKVDRPLAAFSCVIEPKDTAGEEGGSPGWLGLGPLGSGA